MPGILYITDKYKISAGYEPAFTKMVHKCGIPRNKIVSTDIYGLVDTPLKKKANENTWRFNPEKFDAIQKAFAQRVNAIKPELIVVSDPACLGIFTDGDSRSATLEKMRGSVYKYNGITTIITYPITAIHQRLDTRIVSNDDGEEDTQTPYRVKQGAQILNWDWSKIGRYYQHKQRRLPPFRYSVCRTIQDCFAARDYLDSCILISVDIETALFPPQVTCVGYTGILPNGATHSFVIPFYDEFAEGGTFWDSVEDHAIAWSVVRDINDSPIQKTFQNGSYDCSYFIRDRAPVRNYLWDSMVMWWSLYMEMPKKLDFITSILCDEYQYWKDDIKGDDQDKVESKDRSTERYWRYNALDTYYTLWDTLTLMRILRTNTAMQVNYNDAFRRVLSCLMMSMRGVKADEVRRSYHRQELELTRQTELDKLQYILSDKQFNINSPQQKASLLYDFMGLVPRNAKGRLIDPKKPMKGTNAPSAGAIPLKMAKYEHPLFKYIIDQMQKAMAPDKQLSNITGRKDSETGQIKGGLYVPTGRLRTSFNGVGTETTRLSSKKGPFWDGGNLQNIQGKYRDWIVPDEDCIFLDIDYSQSDDVFVAYESEDPDKIAVVESGKDSHAVNGELFFGKTYDWIVAGKAAKDPLVVHHEYGIRQLTKRVCHGTNFQMAGLTLYITMGRDAVVAAAEILGYHDAGNWKQEKLVQLCEMLMKKYRNRYKRLNKREWYADIEKMVREHGQLTNAYGITRKFLGDPDENGTQREATAFLGQSGTGGNMNRVMYEVDHGYIPPRFRDAANPHANEEPRKMDWKSHGFAFHLQVHDNFVAQLNLKHPKWQEAANNLLYVMDRPTIIKDRVVQVRAEAAVGLRWGKNMLDWDGKPETLESTVHQLLTTGKD